MGKLVLTVEGGLSNYCYSHSGSIHVPLVKSSESMAGLVLVLGDETQ